MPEVHQLGGGLEAQADALQAGHVGAPSAETGAPGDEGAGGGGYGGVLAAGSRWPRTKLSRQLKKAGFGGAAVPGRLEVAGTEARSTRLFPYKAKGLTGISG